MKKVQGYETPIKRGKANLSKLANQEEGAIIPDDFGSWSTHILIKTSKYLDRNFRLWFFSLKQYPNDTQLVEVNGELNTEIIRNVKNWPVEVLFRLLFKQIV